MGGTGAQVSSFILVSWLSDAPLNERRRMKLTLPREKPELKPELKPEVVQRAPGFSGWEKNHFQLRDWFIVWVSNGHLPWHPELMGS
jgi:hypothetical protein